MPSPSVLAGLIWGTAIAFNMSTALIVILAFENQLPSPGASLFFVVTLLAFFTSLLLRSSARRQQS